MQGFLELRISVKSDSRTVNLVNDCANLHCTIVGIRDQNSVSASVLSQLSARHDQKYSVRDLLANQDWGFLSSDFVKDCYFACGNMIECKCACTAKKLRRGTVGGRVPIDGSA